MRNVILNFFLFALIISITGCYTQLQTVDRSADRQAAGAYEQQYYYMDDSLNQGTTIYNYYDMRAPYTYDPFFYDPWFRYSSPYWGPTSHWGVYVSFSYGWDPYWYPWWRGRYLYPFVSAYPWYYGGYYSYWDPYYYGYYGGGPYYYVKKNYKKRPFDRRTPYDTRRIVRGNRTGEGSFGKATDHRRIIRSDADYTDNSQNSTQSQRRIIRRDRPVRVLTSSRTSSDRDGTRILKRTPRSTHRGSTITNRRHTPSRSGSSYRGSQRSSSSRSYTPRRSSSHGSSSRSSVRSSSGSRSSRSSSSSSSSSSSGSSKSSSRSAKRK